MRTHTILPALAALLLAGAHPAARAEEPDQTSFRTGDITVTDAWTPVLAQPGTTHAYMTIHNDGALDHLVGASCTHAFGTTLNDEHMPPIWLRGLAPMDNENRRVSTSIDIPAHGTLTMAAGNTYVTIQDMDITLAAGQRISCLMTFQRAGPLEVMLDVRAAPAAPAARQAGK